MKAPSLLTQFAVTVLAGAAAASSQGPMGLTSVGAGWGTNIHWTAETRKGEAAMLSQAYRVARMDFNWASIEKTCGSYDFGAYDTLLATMEANGVRPYWILDYGNPCYPPAVDPAAEACKISAAACKQSCGHTFNTCEADGVWYCCASKDGDAVCNGHHRCGPYLFSCACTNETTVAAPLAPPTAMRVRTASSTSGNMGCDTAECIAAFQRFASAAVNHFKGHGIIFECLNEPNGMGGDNSSTITKLCKGAGAAIRAVPGEIFVGPATATFPWVYLNETMNDGILSAFTALSVHPYRGDAPESVLDDYAQLRAMMADHGVTDMPVLSGEWGYTTAVPPCVYPNKRDPVTQGAYQARMWLINTLAGIPVSINYDWSDGSGGVADCESHFGSVSLDAGPAGEPFTPKPKYLAALALQRALGAFARAGPRVQPISITPQIVMARDVFVLPFVNSTGPPGFAVWSNNTAAVDVCAGAAVPLREDCGHFGISKDACLSPSNPKGPGCCWEPNQPKVGGPQCYNVRKPAQVTVTFAGPAKQCWAMSDFLGNPIPTSGSPVCANDAGVVTVSTVLTSTGNATAPVSTPVYLVPAPV